MKTKTINYVTKNVQKGFAYCDIHPTEMQEILIIMMRWVTQMGELSNSTNKEVKLFINQWWYAVDKKLPKGRNGMNTPCSFISGILTNLLFGVQRDLSTLQMSGIERISEGMANFEKILNECNEPLNSKPTEEKIVFKIGI